MTENAGLFAVGFCLDRHRADAFGAEQMGACYGDETDPRPITATT